MGVVVMRWPGETEMWDEERSWGAGVSVEVLAGGECEQLSGKLVDRGGAGAGEICGWAGAGVVVAMAAWGAAGAGGGGEAVGRELAGGGGVICG